jgi:branched-chain amino acid aminotransferase
VADLINLNGVLCDAASPAVLAANRSLRYGDGLFETMRWESGSVQMAKLHYRRLLDGLHTLKMDVPQNFSPDMLNDEISRLILASRYGDAVRVRLNVFREDSIGFETNGMKTGFIIEAFALGRALHTGVSLVLYEENRKAAGPLSRIKSNNYLLNIMAAIYAGEQRASDALILNTSGRICEASTSNFFMWKNGVLYTPSLEEGCVAGVMRRHLIDSLPSEGIHIKETEISPEMLGRMDEAFLTNAIQGIRPVVRFAGRELESVLTNKLRQLTEKISF